MDLHTHSCASDGELSPEKLVELAAKNAVTLMALTDHDTMLGTPAAMRAAAAHGIRMVTGVEITCEWGRRNIHVVGLNLDPVADGLADFLAGICRMRDERGHRMDEAFARLGIKGAYEGALAHTRNPMNLSRTHFAKWLFESGHVETYQQAFDRYLANGRPCAIRADWPHLTTVVDRIRAAGGVAVLAHPGRYTFEASWMNDELLKAFKAAGGAAIEVASGSQSEAANAHYAEAARRLGFLASTGSDFHSFSGCRPQPGRQPQVPAGLTGVWTLF